MHPRLKFAAAVFVLLAAVVIVLSAAVAILLGRFTAGAVIPVIFLIRQVVLVFLKPDPP